MQRSVASMAALVLVVQGCSVLTDFDRYDRESASAPIGEDGGPDATLDGGADAERPPDANLHPNGSFETDCGSWFGYASTLARSDVARSGSGACLVCADGSDAYFGADDRGALTAPPVGAEYRAEVWVRAAPGEASPSTNILMLRSRNENPFTVVEDSVETTAAIGEAWVRLETTLAITREAERLNVAVSAERGAGRPCFLVDDVTLVRVR